MALGFGAVSELAAGSQRAAPAGASPNVTVALSGVKATGRVGTATRPITVAITGVAGTSLIGAVTAAEASPQPVTVALTGVAGTGRIGPVTATESTAMVPCTLDPTSTTWQGFSFSNGDMTLTAVAQGGAWLTVSSTLARTAGNWYAEATVAVGATEGAGFGVQNYNEGELGQDTNGIKAYTYAGTAGVLYNDTVVGPIGTTAQVPVTGTVLGMAVNTALKRVWFYNPLAGEWNGDVLANQNPATGTGGYDLTAVLAYNGELYLGVDLYTADNTASITINAGASPFSNPVPEGFQAYATPQPVTIALAGVAGVGRAGTLSPTTLAGARATGSAGDAVSNHTVALRGCAAAARTGTTTAALGKALTGAQVASVAGTLQAVGSKNNTLVGSAAVTAARTAPVASTIALAQAHAATRSGAVGRNLTLGVTGAQAATRAGTMASSRASAPLARAEAATAARAPRVTTDYARDLTGGTATGNVGKVKSSSHSAGVLGGLSATANAGAITAGTVVALTGVAATTRAGRLATITSLSGVQASALVGRAGAQLVLGLAGARAMSRTGKLRAGEGGRTHLAVTHPVNLLAKMRINSSFSAQVMENNLTLDSTF